MRIDAVVAMAAWAGLLAAGSDAGARAPLDPKMLMIAPGQTASWVRLAREGAAQRLAEPQCARVFGDFADAAGHPLQEKLDAYGMTGAEYLSLIYFGNGFDAGRCGDESVLATTTPGSRLVSVCGRFARAYRENSTWAEVVVIHEALHTLGLGENPPTSAEISNRVVARCR
ncbi:MAG TPA: hypothetical protein VGN09_16080 [Vicinamibacteria bacterium]|jgi:hypothetical protein